jgi:hypothetical protein
MALIHRTEYNLPTLPWLKANLDCPYLTHRVPAYIHLFRHQVPFLFLCPRRPGPSPVVDVDIVTHPAHGVRHLRRLSISTAIPIVDIHVVVEPDHRVIRVVGVSSIDETTVEIDVGIVDIADPDHEIIVPAVVRVSPVGESTVDADIVVDIASVVPSNLVRPATIVANTIGVVDIDVGVIPTNHTAGAIGEVAIART